MYIYIYKHQILLDRVWPSTRMIPYDALQCFVVRAIRPWPSNCALCPVTSSTACLPACLPTLSVPHASWQRPAKGERVIKVSSKSSLVVSFFLLCLPVVNLGLGLGLSIIVALAPLRPKLSCSSSVPPSSTSPDESPRNKRVRREPLLQPAPIPYTTKTTAQSSATPHHLKYL